MYRRSAANRAVRLRGRTTYLLYLRKMYRVTNGNDSVFPAIGLSMGQDGRSHPMITRLAGYPGRDPVGRSTLARLTAEG